MGWQYRTLARVLLITHDPHIPRMGLGRQAAIEKMNVSFLYDAKKQREPRL